VHVRWLELAAFRNHASLSFVPDPGVNVLTAPNGQGKTSLLEALCVLLSGRSFRTARLSECVRWGVDEAVVTGEVVHGGQRWPVRLRVLGRGGVVAEQELCPWVRAVSFSAADLALLTGPPQTRRAYLDGAAAKLVPAHGEVCRRYRLVLHQRTRLLGQLGGRLDASRLLEPWDEQVATLGSAIVHRRIETLDQVGGAVQQVGRALAPEGRVMELRYVAVVSPAADVAATRERLRAALADSRRAEVARGLTLAGPHRDDLGVLHAGVDARVFASRGEQRLLALTLRLAEAAVVARRLGRPPVLLLDDVLSELDAPTRGRVLDWVGTQGQVVLSSTEAVGPAGGAGAAWDVRPGCVAGGLEEPILVGGGP
jgi:DNA replication and repair protein RecF